MAEAYISTVWRDWRRRSLVFNIEFTEVQLCLVYNDDDDDDDDDDYNDNDGNTDVVSVC